MGNGSLFWQERDRPFIHGVDLGDAPNICRSTTFDNISLPYRVITQALLDQFSEKMSTGTIANFLRYFGHYYSQTERLLIQRILESPMVHVDETQINVKGVAQYVWVFTDGKHVVFRFTSVYPLDLTNSVF
jgi:hypothetical protein